MNDLIMSPDGRSYRRGRRKTERHPVERAAELWRIGDEEHPVVGVALNISTEGIGLHTHEPFDVGDEIMVNIKRDTAIGSRTFIYVRANVMRVAPVGGNRYYVGVQITVREQKPF